MSEQNVALVREIFDAVNKRDDAAALAHCHPDIEIDWTRSIGPERGMYRGHEGWVELLDKYREVFDEVAFAPEEFIERGDEVLVPHLATLSHRDGIVTQVRSVFAYTFDAGVLVRFRMFNSRDEALAAAGG